MTESVVENEEFWTGTEEGKLLIQKCGNCGYLRWPPGPICTECQSPDFAWSEVSGRGVIETYATYHRALNPAYKEDVPYTIGLIELAEGSRILGRITNEIDEIVIGRPVHATFEPLKDGRAFAAWTIDA